MGEMGTVRHPPHDDLVDIVLRVPLGTLEKLHQTGAQTAIGTLPALAKALLAMRQRRSQLFKGVRFSDPAWEMILEIYVAASEGSEFKITKLCIASGAPAVTALRHIDDLIEHGYLVRKADQKDRRSTIVVMQPTLLALVEKWLECLVTMTTGNDI